MCGRYTFWFWVISAVPFYCATWEQYVIQKYIFILILIIRVSRVGYLSCGCELYDLNITS